MNPRAFGKKKKGGVGGMGRELIHSFSCVPACSAHSVSLTLSPCLSISLPLLFLEASHSRESGPSCSQSLSLARALASSSSLPVSLLFIILELKRGRAGGNRALHHAAFLEKDGEAVIHPL